MLSLYPNSSINTSVEVLEKGTGPGPRRFCEGHHVASKHSRVGGFFKAISCLSRKGQCSTQSNCPSRSREMYNEPLPLVLDLRSAESFGQGHVHGSYNCPLQGLSHDLGGGDLFGDARALHWASMSVKEWLQTTPLCSLVDTAEHQRQKVFILCYNGDISRLAVASLRKRGLDAFSVAGGFGELQKGA